MSLVPFAIGSLSFYLFCIYEIHTVQIFIVCIFAFSCIYVPLFWFFGMNAYERTFCFSGLKVCGATAEEFAINMYRILDFCY